MRTIKTTHTLYKYDELSKEAQGKVIDNIVRFYLEDVPYEEMSKEMQKAEEKAAELQTPWFVREYMWDYAREEIEEKARSREYLRDGTILPFH